MRERANGRARGPVLLSLFLAVLNHCDIQRKKARKTSGKGLFALRDQSHARKIALNTFRQKSGDSYAFEEK